MSKRSRKPFTLIELFITLSILLLIGGVCSVKLSSLIKEHRLGVQTRHFERLLTKAHRMSYFLDKDIYVDIDKKQKGHRVSLSSDDSGINKLVGEAKTYQLLDSIQIGKEEDYPVRLVFSKRARGKDEDIIKVLSSVIKGDKSSKKIIIKGFFIKKRQKTLTRKKKIS